MDDYKKLSEKDKKLVDNLVKVLDSGMRNKYVCEICGKPLVGVVRTGQSRKDAGLCICSNPD